MPNELNKTDKVLFVDDELSALQGLSEVLSQQFDLFCATNGTDALNLIKEQAFDLILLDVELPDIPGFKICQQLKANPATRHIPVIFLTGFEDLVFEGQAFDSGAADFICKPVIPARVMMRMRYHIARKKELEQLLTH
ncbi:response regulator [Oceanospirillum sanctuarii]|uniref:response regulator n=1 Tax=Oceanospirillum sanctuarii TaxID=1434821 RepID=UPI000A36365C|nr:response regulator [Oceanospirillum sanctuarii]